MDIDIFSHIIIIYTFSDPCHFFREKEDIYRALLDGHYFLQDSFRDADRMQGVYAPNQRYVKYFLLNLLLI